MYTHHVPDWARPCSAMSPAACPRATGMPRERGGRPLSATPPSRPARGVHPCSSRNLVLHVDKYSANDLKVLFQVLPKVTGMKSIAVTLGEADLEWSESRGVDAALDRSLACVWLTGNQPMSMRTIEPACNMGGPPCGTRAMSPSRAIASGRPVALSRCPAHGRSLALPLTLLALPTHPAAVKKKLMRMGLDGPVVSQRTHSNKLLMCIGRVMQNSPKLAALAIRGIALTPEGLARISKGIHCCFALQRVSLKKCKIGDRGFAAIADAVRLSHSVCELDLQYNDLTDKSGAAVAQILKQHSSARDEDLWAYSLRDDPVDVASHGLVVLDLAHNGLGNKAASEIAAALSQDNWTMAIGLGHNLSLIHI